MTEAMLKEGFGSCSNHYECHSVCPKGIKVQFIAKLNRDLSRHKSQQGETNEKEGHSSCAGNVGASLAQMIVQDGSADVVLYDIAEGIPQGKALDLSEACPVWGSSSSVTGTNDYSPTAIRILSW